MSSPFLKICQLFKSNQEESSLEIDFILQGLQMLSSAMQSALPMATGMFDSAVVSTEQLIKDRRHTLNNAFTIFSGNGPIARKMKEHLVLNDWLDKNNSIMPETSFFTKNSLLERGINLFNFNPIDKETDRESLLDFAKRIREETKKKILLYKRQDNAVSNNLDRYQTGIYSDSRNEQVIVLAGELSREKNNIDNTPLRFVFVTSSNTNFIFYYHPFEMKWKECGYGMTFEGMSDKLNELLDQAYRDALIQPEDFDMMDFIRNHAEVENIFVNNTLLPSILYLDGQSLSTWNSFDRENRQPDAVFSRTSEKLSLRINIWKNLYLTFTQGLEYKVTDNIKVGRQEGMIFPIISSLTHKEHNESPEEPITVNELDRDHQLRVMRALVKTTRILNEEITLRDEAEKARIQREQGQ